METSKEYHCIYKLTNKINNKIYIGLHTTINLDDNYMGSGSILQKAKKKYGLDNFTKEILFVFNTLKEMVDKEREIVNEDFVKRRDTYNLEIGGSGGKIWTKELRNKMSKTQKERFENGELNGMKNKTHTEESKQKMKDNHADVSGENNPMFGKPCHYNMSESEKEIWASKIGKSNKGKIRTEEHKKNYSEAAKKRIWLVHISGKITNTINPNDERLNSSDWQRGKKWKI